MYWNKNPNWAADRDMAKEFGVSESAIREWAIAMKKQNEKAKLAYAQTKTFDMDSWIAGALGKVTNTVKVKGIEYQTDSNGNLIRVNSEKPGNSPAVSYPINSYDSKNKEMIITNSGNSSKTCLKHTWTNLDLKGIDFINNGEACLNGGV